MSLDTIVSVDNATIAVRFNLILTDVNFNIDKGEFVYLVGKTGSGKSSLLRTLYSDIDLFQGEITISDYKLHDLKKKEIPFLRRKLGIVFQDFQLLTDRSIAENLMFVMKATGWKDKALINERIVDALEKVGLETKAHKMPHELSGGEQQRVAIARALINDPELILADEPTGNLDPDTSAEIMKLLVDISKSGRAVLMATHDYSLFEQFPSRTLKCENGKVYDSGPVLFDEDE